MPTTIDLAYLERLYKGDRVRVEHWIRLYLEEAPMLFGQLSTAVEQGDAAGLIATAHDLRPQAHYLGAPQLLALLIAIGDRTRGEGVPACAELVGQVLALSDNMGHELRAMIAPRAGQKPV
jgi:HPt (histidine-containing phosphotransfer) domain-containing protein